jgi:hypothetical protein
MFNDTGRFREGYQSNSGYVPRAKSEERVTSDATSMDGTLRKRKEPSEYMYLKDVFTSNGIIFPEDFTAFMQDIASKTITTRFDGSVGDHYRLERWINNNLENRGKQVHNIYELMAAHANSSPYAAGDITSTLVIALSKTANELLQDPNLHNNCRFDKTQIVTMLMLSYIRCHCAVLYFKTLVKDASKAHCEWYTVTIKSEVQSVPVGAGRYERRTVYRPVIRK